MTEYELELFFEDGGVREIGGACYPVKAGRVLFARPGDIRCSRLHFKCFLHISAFDNLSPIYFHQQYTAAAGHTPHAYLADKRIAMAKVMLRTEDMGVAQVADACGFSSQSYFCACFRRVVGVSPGQYRKNMRYPDA